MFDEGLNWTTVTMLLLGLACACLTVWSARRQRTEFVGLAAGPAAGFLLAFAGSAKGAALVFSAVAGGSLVVWLAAQRSDPRRAWWIGTIVCGALVGRFSGGAGGPDPWIDGLVAWGLDAAMAKSAVFAARKTTHVLFYGATAWCAARLALANGAGVRSAILFGLGVGLTLACLDEARQSFTPGRSGSPWDVGLDAAGMGLFLIPLASGQARMSRRP